MNIYKSPRVIRYCNKCDLTCVHSQLATAASVRVLLSGDVPDAHLEVSVVVGLDEGVDGAHDALLVAVVVVRSTPQGGFSKYID